MHTAATEGLKLEIYTMVWLIQVTVSKTSKKVQVTVRQSALLTVPVGLFEPNTELEPAGLFAFSTDEPEPEPGVEPELLDAGL